MPHIICRDLPSRVLKNLADFQLAGQLKYKPELSPNRAPGQLPATQQSLESNWNEQEKTNAVVNLISDINMKQAALPTQC